MHPINPSGSITTRPRYQKTTASSRLASTKSDLAAHTQTQAPPPPKTVGAPRYRTTTTTTTSTINNNNNRPPPPPTKPKSTLSTLSSSSSSTRFSTGALSVRGTALNPRDRNQNVLSLTATRSTIKMPPPLERPRQPQLSAAAARAANRPPLTPKVAAPKAPSVVTPVVRRTTNQQTPNYTATSSYHREETTNTTPTSAYLGHSNITPRSGTRQSRVDSANSTPSGTPNPERTTDSRDEGRLSIGSGIGSYPISALSYDGGRQTPSADSATETQDSKFFYASAAKTSQPVPSQRPTSVPQKQTTFFYANGTSADNKNNNRRLSPQMAMNPTLSPPLLSPTTETAASKFFYANGTPDVSSKTSLPISSSASAVSSSSRAMPKRPKTSQSTTGSLSLNAGMPQRPISPIKPIPTSTAHTLHKTNSMPPTQPLRSIPLGSPPIISALPGSTQKRHVTIEANPRVVKGQSKADSIPTADTARLSTASNSPEPYSPTSPGLGPSLSPSPLQPAMTMASILQAAEELEDDNESSRGGDSPADLQSPTKSTFSNDAVSELVANARRERKVQDLEITNASLEAINRTLERQLRKQTAELRRYRRLSRAGRLSMASSRVTSDALTEPPIDLSDVDEDGDDIDKEEGQEDEEDFDSLDETDASDMDAESADPDSPNARATIRRKRDEKRLQLDLTKHQELLVDSQKMNQSLKRCLNWSEMLIKEGHRALAYQVRVSDVELGGHILSPPDDDDDEAASQNGDETLQSIRLSSPGPEPLEPPPWAKGPQDRDSGIELPVEGS